MVVKPVSRITEMIPLRVVLLPRSGNILGKWVTTFGTQAITSWRCGSVDGGSTKPTVPYTIDISTQLKLNTGWEK